MRYLEKYVLVSVVDGKIVTSSAREAESLKPLESATDYKCYMATQLRKDGQAKLIITDITNWFLKQAGI